LASAVAARAWISWVLTSASCCSLIKPRLVPTMPF
jgi:hypothetical protein